MFPSIPIIREIDESKKWRGLTQPSPQSYEDSKKLYKTVMGRRIQSYIDYTKQPYLLAHKKQQNSTKTNCSFAPFALVYIVIVCGILIAVQ